MPSHCLTPIESSIESSLESSLPSSKGLETVQFEATIAIRTYDGDLVIAQTLHPPYLSVAAHDEDAVRAKIEVALVDELRRWHPREFLRLTPGSDYRALRIEASIFEAYDVYDEEQDMRPITVPMDLVHAYMPGGLEEIRAPVFSLWTLNKRPDDLSPYELDMDAVETILEPIRQGQFHTLVHRPSTKAFGVTTIRVDFEPLDLVRIDLEEIWQPVFAREDLEETQEHQATPKLEEVAQAWTRVSKKDALERGFEQAFERDDLARQIQELLSAKRPVAVVLVGPARSGKTRLVHHLVAEQIKNRATSSSSLPFELWYANAPRLASAPMFSSGWQEQCRELFAELEGSDGILYLGRLVEALDAGKYVGSDYNLAQFLKPLLADKRLRLIAEATVEEWNLIEQRDVGFARTFQIVRVHDPKDDVAQLIVAKAAQRIAIHDKVRLADGVVARAWGLQKRFVEHGSTVGRTIDFIARVVREVSNKYIEEVSEMALIESFCQSTGLPLFLLMDDHALDLDEVVSRLATRVIGQDDAVRRVADVIGITKAGLASPDRPLGSFLFVGPTGVGKTELARTLSSFLFGDEARMIRLDMSEYSGADAYARLIGEGREDGELTGPVRRQPFSVVLLDEIEKANASVFDVLLQVLGEARLTDAHGRITRFQNTIVIMTSNLGVETMRPSIGFSGDGGAQDFGAHFRKEAEKFFRPEFLARIDQFIPFQPLSLDTVTSIAGRELDALFERDGLARSDVMIDYEPSIVPWLASRGLDAKYGARPLKRTLEREVVWPLSRLLAKTAPELEVGQVRQVQIAPGEGELTFDIQILDPQEFTHTSRQELLQQIMSISALRRKLGRYIHASLFGDLEWEIENFDLSSQSSSFWRTPRAAEIATRAERARRVVSPAEDMAAELAELEDLAHEAYHSRDYDIHADISERVEELEEKVRQLFLVILSSAFDLPDETVLMMPVRRAGRAWRAQLIRWYISLCKRYGWSWTLYATREDLDHIGEATLLNAPEDAYHVAGKNALSVVPATDVVALKIQGTAVRPMLLAEDGLHRLIAQDRNGVLDVIVLMEHQRWLLPSEAMMGRPNPQTARVWNRRTHEVTIPYVASVELRERDPWEHLIPILEEVVWHMLDDQWDG